MEQENNIEKLLKITAMLRDEEHGCAWDLKQDFQSITPHTLEEVYEVLDCIERQDFENLPNELGDLLFQVVLYAQFGKEEQSFDFNDVVNEICEKLLRRHPHVFPDGTTNSYGDRSAALTPHQIENRWEEIKALEKKNTAVGERESLLDSIPNTFSALLKAQKIQKKVASAGFDWPEIKPVIEKLREEIDELEEAATRSDKQGISEELGDVFFSLVNLSRHFQLDAEKTLRKANNKFELRFRLLEQKIRKENRNIKDMSLKELDLYWSQVKSELKQ